MKNQYHILNGDSLKEQFPKEIDGKIIVARECLVDGDVRSATLDELFKLRAKFISEAYGDFSIGDYYAHSVSEFEKILKIPENAEVNLWFEDDLFCQVNLWFIIHLLLTSLKKCKVFLIRPAVHTQFGFGGLNELELTKLYIQRTEMFELDKLASLWKFYQNNNLAEMVKIGRQLEEEYPFILNVVEAHVNRLPNENSPGRPVEILREIMHELKTDSFVSVFREFNKRASIYGFGDLQVKRLLDGIKNNR
ncbi:hypothetical protein MATR_12850 [Marivirga tractuosa]|uniref:DUF1835 domain-containing protein n=1 Tax=Marivirga tractuosa (strain ATCC 23168 / DSM 4126 / NBRC 15989 / NCIMB 1408 / VKM B-1430 / H-43) TaxID=643867 RepID=E4TUY0_MARTH|nr:DUF1835 domain-containing protein [Marivirga tractuosa]ADR21085.1 hypothetical protein Ftrac_1090 [Marivirga tractuosa DSM 4126]BDD14460.1 hypothetical protein MATR_12850 [Marivirga tractuosa]